jgi:levanase/fructan beta-fructosidase
MKMPVVSNYENFSFMDSHPVKSNDPIHYTIEGDWSGAAFLFVAGAISGRVIIKGMKADSHQADKKILEAIKDSGASLEFSDGNYIVSPSKLHVFNFDATECPDLFPLAVDGDENKIKWVLIISLNPGGLTGGSGTQYFIGNWNGKEFTADEGGTRWLDYGRDNYAGVTFNDAPNSRRIFIGWMNNWEYAHNFPTDPWRGAMTLPRELSLISRSGKVILAANPVVELNNYLGENLTAGKSAELLEIKTTVSIGDGLSKKIRTSGENGSYFEFGYDAKSKSIFVDRSHAWQEIESTYIHSAPITGDEKILDINVIVDRSSVEIFAAGGTYVLTDLIFLTGANPSVTFEIADGCQAPRSLEVRAISTRR